MTPTSSGSNTRGPGTLRWTLITLCGIFAAGLIIRLWGIDYGLPYIYHTDEIFEVKRALKLGAGQFDLQRAFKGGLYYLLFVEYGFLYLLLRLFGEIRTSFDFLVRFFAYPTEFWLIGRATVAVLGALNVALVYRLGTTLHNRRTGMFSALLIAFATRHVESSHYITVDVLMGVLLTLAFIQIAMMIKTGSLRNYLLAAVFAALAVSTKLTAITILIPIALARAYRVAIEGLPLYRLVFDKRILYAFGLFVLTMGTVNPGFFPELYHLIEHLRGTPAADPSMIAEMDPFPSRTDNIPLFYIRAIVGSMGLPIFILSILGSVLVLTRRNPAGRALLLFSVATYALICFPWQPDLIYDRYTLPIQIVLALFAAYFLDACMERLAGMRLAKYGVVAIALFAAAIPLCSSLRQDILMTRTDTRTTAKNWIEETVPQGARILIEGRGYRSSPNTAPLMNLPKNVVAEVSTYRATDPRWEEDSDYGPLKDRFHRAAVVALEGKLTYDLVLTGSGSDPCRRLDEYIDDGVEYILIDPVKLEKFLTGINYDRYPAVGDLYRDIKTSRKLRLLRRFEPVDCLGPVLEFYRVEKSD